MVEPDHQSLASGAAPDADGNTVPFALVILYTPPGSRPLTGNRISA